MPSKTCPICSTAFHVKPSHMDKKTYCSAACMAEGYRQRMRGAANPNYRPDRPTPPCKMCGTPITVYTKGRIYCSVACRDADPEFKEKTRQNGRVTKVDRPPGSCRVCALPIKAGRVYCGPCYQATWNPFPVCELCAVVIPIKHPRRFCDACRAEGKHRVPPPVSICTSCGATVPAYGRKYCDSCWLEKMRMRHGGRKVDENHVEIVAGLEAIGVSVLDLSQVGRGCPDIAAGKDGIVLLIEIKNARSRGKLNRRQVDWHTTWRGSPVAVVYTLDEAIAAVEAAIGRSLRV